MNPNPQREINVIQTKLVTPTKNISKNVSSRDVNKTKGSIDTNSNVYSSLENYEQSGQQTT